MSHMLRQRGENWLGRRLWTALEDDICHSEYPNYTAMAKKLPHRTHCALKNHCLQLGICKPRPQWLANQDTQFRKMYKAGSSMDELRRAFPHLSRVQIWNRASHCRLYRPKKKYSPTGIDLLDHLRSECARRHVTMADLDHFAKAKRYFTQRLWRGERGFVDFNYIVRGIHELGGTLSVQWGIDQ
ncbi:hypothetical protein NKH47_17675 [Mesorhizobium sp. M1060]|uniref:hypothetical protein n=1 Tax=unclassified Mesorhizobium TaxID=325217 RepID=UPI0003CE531F|nr:MULTISPECIES: hypothetical protein [unclassified Mesorhizobium]ESX32858.1 hypothetical protein X765_03610 [Mesorhizobium sp. LSHC440B00]WJI59273.1 hypothetical protein NLY33_11425 [Mesorhizobium sp. C432A]